MKILILSKLCSYPSWQGSAQHARTFANVLLENNVKVEMVSAEYVSSYQSESQDGYTVHKIPMRLNNDIVKNFTDILSKHNGMDELAKKIIDTFNPDVIHVGVPIYVTDFIFYGRSKHIPIIAIVHSFEWLCMQKFLITPNNQICSGPTIDKCSSCLLGYMSFRRKFITIFLNKFNFFNIGKIFPKKIVDKIFIREKVRDSIEKMHALTKNIDLFLVQTLESKKIMHKMGIPNNKMRILKQWLVDEKLNTKVISSPNEKLKFGFIGNISYIKGLATIFKALKDIKNKQKMELWILSNGVTESELEKLFSPLASYQMDIKLFGDLQGNRDLPDTIAELDICIVPSIWREVGPRVLLEAIAQKVPCISANTVGNNYLIDNDINGKIFSAGNHHELSKIMNQIIDNPQIVTDWKSRLPKIRSKKDWFPEIMNYHTEMLNSK